MLFSYLSLPVYILIAFLALFFVDNMCVKPRPIQPLCSFLYSSSLTVFLFHWALLGVLHLPMSPYFSSLFFYFDLFVFLVTGERLYYFSSSFPEFYTDTFVPLL